MSSGEIMGLTVHDLNLLKSHWGVKWAEEMKKMDWLIQENKERVAVKDGTIYLVSDGFLRYEKTIKYPLVGHHGKVIGIFTSSEDLTTRLSNLSLYYLYKKVCGKKAAIKKLLHHLEIEAWFFALPTEAELLVLIKRATGRADKEIARAHGVSTRTIETHFVTLRTKLKGDVLPNIVFHLRNPSHVIDKV